jgi:uncharacterized protein
VSVFFVDTSALAKRYVSEIGSYWVMSWIEPQAGNVIVVSELTYAELHSVFERRSRESTLSPARASTLRNEFSIHYQDDFLLVLLSTRIVKASTALLQKYPLRALDSIQLACAIESLALLQEPITFVSADNNLLTAAASEGFATDNPNNHP